MEPTTWAVVAVLFVAALVRSALGFGEALVAVPLLALIVPIEVVAPVAALTSVTVAAIILIQDRADVHMRSAVLLVLSTLVGLPLGLLLLIRVADHVVQGLLAIVIISFSAFMMVRRPDVRLSTDRTAWLYGLVAGILGGAYGMNGPPLVVYGGLRGWSPRHFRATLQGYFLPASALGAAGFLVAGLWTTTVTRYYLMSLLPILVAVVAGRHLNRRIHPERFPFFVHGGLVLVGILLLGRALSR